MSHGADPEFVIVDGNGKPVPAHKAGIGGKNEKFRTFQGTFFRDGYNLEINPLPAACRAIFGNNVRGLLNTALSILRPKGLGLAHKTFFEVDLDELADAPPDVVEFGCNPSFDAWNNGIPRMVNLSGRHFSRRMTGGHLHLTDDGNNLPETAVLRDPEKYPVLVQKFDEYLGLLLSAVYDNPEQWERRKFYGAAGDYRPQRHVSPTMYPGDKEYVYLGVEYRTPPSDLFKHHAMVCLAFGIMRWVVQNVSMDPEFAKPVSPERGAQIRHAINTGEGVMDLLPSVPGYYDKDTVVALKKQPEIYTFHYVLSQRECHAGWNEYANEWDLKRPGLPKRYWESEARSREDWTYAHGFRQDWRWAEA